MTNNSEEINTLIYQYMKEANLHKTAEMVKKTLPVNSFEGGIEELYQLIRQSAFAASIEWITKSDLSEQTKSKLVAKINLKEFFSLINSNSSTALKFFREKLSKETSLDLTKLSKLVFMKDLAKKKDFVKRNFIEFLDTNIFLKDINTVISESQADKGKNLVINPGRLVEILKIWRGMKESQDVELTELNTFELEQDEIRTAALDGSLSKLAIVYRKSKVVVLNVVLSDTIHFEQVGSFMLHQKAINSICFSADSNTFATASNDNTVKISCSRTGRVLKTYSFNKDYVSFVRALPDNTFFSGSIDKNFTIFSVDSVLNSAEFCRIKEAHFSKKLDSFVIVPYSKSPVKIVNKQSLTVENEISTENFINSSAISKGGDYLLLNLSRKNASIDLINLVTLEVENKYFGHMQAYSIIDCCFFGEKEEMVVSGSEDFNIYVWDRVSANLKVKLVSHKGIVGSLVAFDYTLLSFSDDFTFKVWSRDYKSCSLKEGGRKEIRFDVMSPGSLDEEESDSSSY